MLRTNAALALALIWLLLTPWPGLAAEIILRSEDQLRYARALMEQGHPDRAITELDRFLAFFPEDPRGAEVRVLLAVAHLEAKHYPEALRRTEELLADQTEESPRLLLLLGETYYRMGRYSRAQEIFSRVVETAPDSRWKNAALYRLGWARVKTYHWESAAQAFSAVETGAAQGVGARQLAGEVLHGRDLPEKSPQTAGVLAALLPGLGHTYVGRPKDGAVAFILNGLFIWATIEAFRNDHDALAGMLAFLELGWYTGNIYSAVNAAHKHNRKLRRDFIGTLTDTFDVRLMGGRRGSLTLALHLPF